MPDISIHRVERLHLRFAPRPWAFAQERREEIEAYFSKLQQDKPLWNGRVLLMFEHALSDGALRGSYLETDFASFVAWRDWGFPDKNMRNCFAPAALQAADGAFILGVMGEHTANAGQIYFPCGTPDPDDVKGDQVDLDGSARRELLEETGISADELDIAPGWHAVVAPPRIAIIKVMQSTGDGDSLLRRIRSYIALERKTELADAYIVRGPNDLNGRMPDFTRCFLADFWQRMQARVRI